MKMDENNSAVLFCPIRILYRNLLKLLFKLFNLYKKLLLSQTNMLLPYNLKVSSVLIEKIPFDNSRTEKADFEVMYVLKIPKHTETTPTYDSLVYLAIALKILLLDN